MQTLDVVEPAQTREVWRLLGQISDPEIPVLTITDLGMVRSVHHRADGWHIGFTPTYSGCPATEFLLKAIREAMAQADLHPVHIEQMLYPAWTTDWMTPAAKTRLREYGISPPQGHACHATSEAVDVSCPRCGSVHTSLISEFGSTACKALYRCDSCREPFDYFKCI
ncbi:1,2-phenylacetyl-CoA epoxidase subunit PaaD [Buttiauxella sp.]|uniref:1,2-phenylacetyl-CoA epoxidase subunit PaaD n=1 Tax=Buttiauxella sp. TaxID=1972222 RepID=UPI003C77EA04